MQWALAEIGGPSIPLLQSALDEARSKPTKPPDDPLSQALGVASDPARKLEKALAYVSAKQTDQLPLENAAGRLVTVAADRKNLLIVMATWCPHSEALAQLLSGGARRMTEHWTLNFVFGDEWPSVKRQLLEVAKEDNLSAGDVERRYAELRRVSGDPRLYRVGF